MSNHRAIADGLQHIFRGIELLKTAFPTRAFTIDGRLVGDIGEVIAALEYDITIDDVSRATHDGVTSDGRLVQVKATFQSSLTFKSVPDLYLGFKLHPTGEYEEVFNGPGQLIFDRYSHRKGIGTSLLSFPVAALREMSAAVPSASRVSKRGA